MPIACFQLPMSKNYDFTNTKDCLQTGIVGCLTPSIYITRLPLVISLKSTQIPITHLRYDTPPP